MAEQTERDVQTAPPWTHHVSRRQVRRSRRKTLLPARPAQQPRSSARPGVPDSRLSQEGGSVTRGIIWKPKVLAPPNLDSLSSPSRGCGVAPSLFELVVTTKPSFPMTVLTQTALCHSCISLTLGKDFCAGSYGLYGQMTRQGPSQVNFILGCW